ncbi:MAG: hypothetical protein OXF45_03570 [Candidatus Dadabacteria bacterium]|nr:hypothetical protein [Candidatus Dadabacteria bacterium]
MIAIDGSNLVQRVNNGFPGAEAGLLMVSVVSIKLDLLHNVAPEAIPEPSVFHNMETACTLEAALPGIGVVQQGIPDDTPKDFFRRKVYETLSGTVAGNHESLLETLRTVYEARERGGGLKWCPADGCNESHVHKQGEYECGCSRREKLFETDILRMHEYFKDVGSSGEAHGRLRDVVEALTLLNILRFFAEKEPAYLADCAFVLDGPLAMFGSIASILPSIRDEYLRLNEKARSANNGKDIVVFGIEKTGRFFQHWEEIDWSDEKGPRSRFPNKTVIALDNDYICRNIEISGGRGKPYGTETYYGRKVFYKTNKGEHVVLNTAMLNKASGDFRRNDLNCYPRLGDILDVMDQLATHLYRDGFMPLTRAHAHAAIPLKRGADIIKSLLEDD